MSEKPETKKIGTTGPDTKTPGPYIKPKKKLGGKSSGRRRCGKK